MQNIVNNWFTLFIRNFNVKSLEFLYGIHLNDCYAGPNREFYQHIDIQNYIYDEVKFTCIMFTMYNNNKLMIILDSTHRGRICNHEQLDESNAPKYPYGEDHSIPMVGLWISVNGLNTSVCLKKSLFALKVILNTYFDIKIKDHIKPYIDSVSYTFFEDFIKNAGLGERVSNTLAAFVVCDHEVDMKTFDDKYVKYIEYLEKYGTTDGAPEEVILTHLDYWETQEDNEPQNIKKAVDLLKSDGKMVITTPVPNVMPPMYSEEKKEPAYDDINMMEQLREFISEFNKFVTKYGVNHSIQIGIRQNCEKLMKFISKYN